MLPKSLETKSNRVTEGGTDSTPRPGDYDLGSLESRAAARALLDSKSASDQQNRLRVVRSIGKSLTLEKSTCLRYQCADSRDPSRNLVIEMVDLDGGYPTDAQSERLEQWIRTVPIDGKTYKFAEVGNC